MSAKRKLKRIAPPLLYTANSTAGKSLTHTEYSLRIIYNLQFEESNFWFDIYSFISLLLFNKNNTYSLFCTNDRFQQTGEISHFIKALRLRQLRVKLISRVDKESSDSLFPGERRLISLQHSEMLSISLRFHCLSADMFCTAFSNAKPPRNIHAAREVTLSRF